MSKQKKQNGLTPKQLERLREQAVMATVVLVGACLMDEFGYKAADLQAFAERFERYQAATKEHLITIKLVKQIMNKEMGYDEL